MDRRIFKYCIVTYVLFACIAKDAITEALHCYSCGWNSNEKKCEIKNKSKTSEDLPFPLPTRCIRGTRPPSKEDLWERGCEKRPCDRGLNKPACLRWSFLASGSLENITYTCVGNPDNRKGKFEVDWSSKDDKKKHNAKTYKVEVFLCNDDYCNGAFRHFDSTMFVWTFLLLFIAYKKQVELNY